MEKPAEKYRFWFNCRICLENKTVDEMFRRANCCHNLFFCADCMGEYVAGKVGENVLYVRCPALHCDGDFIRPKDCQSFLRKEVMDRWEAAICEYHITSTHTVVYCPFNDCSAPLVVDGGGKKAVVITSAECPHCHRLFCARCKVPWHAGSKCKKNKSNRNVKKMDKKFRGLVRVKNWKRCPRCSFYVERDSGCEHISCRCGHEFCYICQRSWSYGHTCPLSFIRNTIRRTEIVINNIAMKLKETIAKL